MRTQHIKSTVNFRHQFTLDVRWGDMDAYGHVNNTLYFRYLESARFSYFETYCLPLLEERMPMIVVADIQCSFEKPIHYPATLCIKSKIIRLGKSSFDFYNEIWQKETRTAHAYTIMVWLDEHTGKPIPIPPVIVSRIQEIESL